MAVVKPEIIKSEYEMFSEYKRTRSPHLRNELINAYIYIAEILSRKFINRGVDYDDIYQVACMGVMYAVDRFDPDRGVKFATFATPTVMGEIRKYFRDKGNFIRIPRRLYETFYKAEKVRRLQGGMSRGEVARIMNIPEKTLEELYEMGDVPFIKSLEFEAYADGEMALANVVGVEDKHYLMIENEDFIRSVNEQLTQEEKDFLRMRYDEEKSQKEISLILGVSQMQVSRIEKKVLKKVRNLYFKD